ncbi:hypothetical protein CC86DRAFT_450253 [Ophiobolus disseminans]|uniref:Uncharacterized protein n=1 Tax=Ophiobolus disseminans TaxID=1469910 RepID=A0A6A6ZFD2_9PLEO|nr:hypothetical protein CC86DRAFT_450253 [Ophiobolus disseminans]
MSSKDNLALDLEHGVRRWDRSRWISVFSSHNPTIREVTECLGLGLSASSSTTNRGIPKFDNPDYRKLSSEVTKLSKELPKERDALLDFAADPTSLDVELEDLLGLYGPAIWGGGADRTCLLTPDPMKKTYNKDLLYEVAEHKEILKIHLHRWIIIKACYYIRNMKLKRPSGANDYDTLADIDGESQLSPHGTAHSLTPPDHDATPGAELDVKPVNGKKRKSEAFGSLSDGEEHSSTPAKRQYHTMPVNRRSKSPRKSLHNLLPGGHGSIENVPPLPSHKLHLSPSPANGVEPARVQLSPLSNNELNGTSRQPTAIPATSVGGGFTAVNSGGLRAVNTAPPVRELSRGHSRTSSRERKHTSPSQPHRDASTYTSPYDPASSNVAPVRPVSESASAQPPTPAPVSAPTTSQGFHSVNVPADTIVVKTRDSPVVQSVQHAHIAPQPSQQSQPQAPQPIHDQARGHHQGHPYTAQQAQERAAQLMQARIQAHSRANSPSNHLIGRSLAPHPRSRSNTPHAPAASTQPHTASNPNIAPGPAVQTAHAYGMSLIPTQPATSSSSHPPPQQQQHVAAPQPDQPHPQQPHQQSRHQPVLKSQPAEAPQPQTAPRATAVSVSEIRGLQCEVTALLLHFLFPKPSLPVDESALLHRINSLWYHGESLIRPEIGQHYDITTHILTLWLQERFAIASLTHSLATHPGLPPNSAALVDRLLAMNDLRAMRHRWKNMSAVDGMSAEDLLVKAFCALTMTEQTEFMWKEGLARLERVVFEFLRGEEGKIVMQRR